MSQSEAVFLDFSCRKLHQLAHSIVVCLDALDDAEIWARSNESSNAVGNLVLHLAGNVRQWLLCGVGGAPDLRQRDTEFAARALGRAALRELLTRTIQESIAVLQALPHGRLLEAIEIQGFRLTVLETIYHVVEHFSGHTYQIILLAKSHRDQAFDFYSYLSGPHETETP